MPLKEVRGQLHGLFPRLLEVVDLLQRGFIQRKPDLLDLAEKAARGVLEDGRNLTERVIWAGRAEQAAARYVSIPGHLERIADYLHNMAGAVRLKNRESILFSDKAVDEINFLFEVTKEILSHTADTVLVQDSSVAGHMRHIESSVGDSVARFHALHEERLMEGFCLPKASAIYLELLDAFKAVAWHSKEIAQKLAE